MKPLLITALVLAYSLAYSQRKPKDIPASAPHTWQATMESQLRRLQCDDAEGVGYTIYDIATTWAAAGFIDQANLLLTEFWDYKIRDPDDFKYANDGLRVLWALSGKQPAAVPFKLKPIDKIVQYNWDYLFNLYPGVRPVIPDSIASKSWEELSGRALEGKILLLSCDIRNPDHRASRQSQEQAVLAFSRYFATENPIGYDLYHTSTAAAIVAAGLGEVDSAKTFIVRFGQGYLQYPSNFMLAVLMQDTATAHYLLRGILAPVWGITDASCTADLKKVEALLSERVKNGPSLVFGQLPLKTLLQRLSDSAINKKDIDFDDTVRQSKWLGYAPATAARIRAAEKRLGIKLPEDYKAFLLVTNGFRATGNTDINFLPVERIGWLRDLDSEAVAIVGNAVDENDSAHAAGYTRSIIIGGLKEEQQFLLVPPGGKDKEWQYWFSAFWLPGEKAYPSLRFYLEYELQFMMDL
jgi:hypothetical protein